ncbi:hypothetical protein THIOM_003626, partial [Candidatus Thiomargarita nelsonii]
HLIETRFQNLSELANLDKGQERQWLPEMAQPLKHQINCRCFGRDTELEQILRALTGKYSRNATRGSMPYRAASNPSYLR